MKLLFVFFTLQSNKTRGVESKCKLRWVKTRGKWFVSESSVWQFKRFALDLDRSQRIESKTTFSVIQEHLLYLSDDFSTGLSVLGILTKSNSCFNFSKKFLSTRKALIKLYFHAFCCRNTRIKTFVWVAFCSVHILKMERCGDYRLWLKMIK